MKKHFYAPKVKVSRVVSDIDKAIKKIDMLWEDRGMGPEELIFWSQRRSILHTLRDEMVSAYRVIRTMRRN